MRLIILLSLMFFITSCGEKKLIDETGIATNKPYKISGQWYYPLLKADGYDEKGIASWYGKDFHGKKTSNGERYDMHRMSAAHPTLPMGTKVRVTNLENNKSMILRINDRGPFVKERLIDLSYAAAKKMGYARKGTTRVRVQVVDKAATEVSVTRYQPNKPVKAIEKQRKVTITPVRGMAEVVSITPQVSVPMVELKPKPTTTIAPLKSTPVLTRGMHHYVQLGAFSTVDGAKELRETYLGKFPELKIFSTLGQVPVMYKVRQGPFVNRNEAEAMASRMEMAGIPHLSLAHDEARSASLAMRLPSPISERDIASNKTTMPKPAQVTAAKTSLTSTNKAGVYVQIGAFSSFKRAQVVRDRYASQYASTQVYRPKLGDPSIYRVQIGPIADMHKVSAMIDTLEASGVDKAIIVVKK